MRQVERQSVHDVWFYVGVEDLDPVRSASSPQLWHQLEQQRWARPHWVVRWMVTKTCRNNSEQKHEDWRKRLKPVDVKKCEKKRGANKMGVRRSLWTSIIHSFSSGYPVQGCCRSQLPYAERQVSLTHRQSVAGLTQRHRQPTITSSNIRTGSLLAGSWAFGQIRPWVNREIIRLKASLCDNTLMISERAPRWDLFAEESSGETLLLKSWSCAFSLSVTLQRLKGTEEMETSDQSMRSSVKITQTC